MTNNPFNPLNWVRSAQDWFRRTERSSGFRPYLIFLIIHAGFALTILTWFRTVTAICDFTVNSLYFTFGGFVLLFAVKCFQDPNFCRSEKHIENVRRLELMEAKGDKAPRMIYAADVEVVSNPDRRALPESKGGAQ